MPSQTDKNSFARLQIQPTSSLVLVPKLPDLPDDVKKRFPSMVLWQQQMEKWREQANLAIGKK